MNNGDQMPKRTPLRERPMHKKKATLFGCLWAGMIISGILILCFDLGCFILSVSNPSWISDYYIAKCGAYGTVIIPLAVFATITIWHL